MGEEVHFSLKSESKEWVFLCFFFTMRKASVSFKYLCCFLAKIDLSKFCGHVSRYEQVFLPVGP